MKKFIALALTLAMLVSCLVFTASAEDNSVAVIAQSPTSITAGDTFTVDVRVKDNANVVGGVQGVLDVNGADIIGVTVNPEVKTWNNTEDEATIYKLDEAEDKVTFAALNSLEEDTHDTRLWFKVECKAATDDVAVIWDGVKVSDKEANLITAATSDLDIAVSNPAEGEASISVKGFGLRDTNNVEKQALVVGSEIANFNKFENLTEVGVIFYPTGLLGGEELTLANTDAVVASAEAGTANFNAIVEGGTFNGILSFGFSTKEKALRFLGTKVTARVYYKLGETVHYVSNTVDKYIVNGVVNKAALNHILDNGNQVTTHAGEITVEKYKTAKAALNTSNAGWQDNRQLVLDFLVENKAQFAK
ncbi:MAG: hypothetical protein J6L58_00375 [Clostridia bacterium]|nr:hypothetical protein [Clostridia bacterium]